MATPKVRTFNTLLDEINSRTKAASDSVRSVPEKDPANKGTVSIPKDSEDNPGKLNIPASATNTDTQAVLSPPKVVETVGSTAKAANLATKAATMASNIKGLMKKKSEFITLPNMPPNTVINKGTGAGAQKPVPPGAGTHGDPISKTAEKTAPMLDSGICPDCKKPTAECSCNKEAKSANVTIAGLDAEQTDFLAKCAVVSLQFEEGRRAMEYCIQKAHGMEVAADIIKTASVYEQMHQEALEGEGEAVKIASALWEQATPEEQALLAKVAAVHQLNLSRIHDPVLQEAYILGAKQAAAMADAGMMEEQMPEGMAEPGSDPTGGPITEENLLAAIAELVQSGQIPPEVAEQILQELMGAGGGAPGAEGDPGAGGPPMGELPMEDPAASPEEKEAAAICKQACALALELVPAADVIGIRK